MDGRHGLSEVLPRIDAAKFAGTDESEENSICIGSPAGVSSVPGLSPYDGTSKLSFLLVVVDSDIGVGEEVGELDVIA